MSVGIVILLSVVVVLWLYFLWSRRRFYLFSLKVPGPIGWPILGIALKFKSFEALLPELQSMSEQYKTNTLFAWVGPIPFLSTKDPVVVEKILTSPHCVDKPFIYDVFVESLGAGLLTIDPPKSDIHRKLLNPAFNHSLLVSFFPIFNEGTNDFLKKLDELVECGPSDLSSAIYRVTLSVSVEATMGLNGKEYRERSVKLLPYTKVVQTITMNRLIKPWLRFEPLFRLSSSYKPYKEGKKMVDGFVHEVISLKLAERREQDKTPSLEHSDKEDDTNEDKKSKKHIFIEHAIDLYLKGLFDAEDFLGESSSMIYAAFETTATTLFSVLTMLAMHPQYQDNLFEELFSIYPEKDLDVNYEDLQKMIYMDMVINETFRVAATVPVIARCTTADVYVTKDLTIPKGTQLLVDIFDMHRRKDFWGPNATSFNPDNFLPGTLAEKHPYAFIPFSKGARNCIGWRYATMFLKVVIAKTIRNYRISTEFPFEHLQYVANLTIKFKDTPQLEFHRR